MQQPCIIKQSQQSRGMLIDLTWCIRPLSGLWTVYKRSMWMFEPCTTSCASMTSAMPHSCHNMSCILGLPLMAIHTSATQQHHTLWYNDTLAFDQCGIDESASNAAVVAGVLFHKPKKNFPCTPPRGISVDLIKCTCAVQYCTTTRLATSAEDSS